MTAYSPTGTRIVGTAETVPATAVITEGTFRVEGGALVFDYEGSTDLDWNEQTTDEAPGGGRVFVDTDGTPWAESKLVLRDE